MNNNYYLCLKQHNPNIKQLSNHYLNKYKTINPIIFNYNKNSYISKNLHKYYSHASSNNNLFILNTHSFNNKINPSNHKYKQKHYYLVKNSNNYQIMCHNYKQ
jgi:hypothetical protein